MALTWDNYREIAQALAKHYPGTDRLDLEEDAAIEMIIALPGFADKPVPPKADTVEGIITAWYQLDKDEAEKGDPYA